eukprot:m.78656 g.78656  ORF g.78656 m.78656 type:complete len:248 (+) comp12541_c0_seq1:87-830(+)
MMSINDLWVFLASIVAWYALDKVIVATKFFPYSDKNGRYFTLHTICNFIVVVTGFDDVVYSYMDPVNAAFGPCDNFGISVMMGLHIYHIINFRPLDTVDWVHHILMIFITTPSGYFTQPGYKFMHGAFYATGLPGGIDYAMLVAVKKGWMSSLTEKKYNAILQQWIRAPGLVIDTFLVWLHAREYHRRYMAGMVPISTETPAYEMLPYWFLMLMFAVDAVILYWNGLYFASRVLRSHERHSLKAKAK